MPATNQHAKACITLADIHGSIETYEVENTLFMQIWDLLHGQGHKVDKLKLPEVMVIKDKHYGQPGYTKPFVQADAGLQVRSSLDEFIAPVSDDRDLPATTVPVQEENPVEATTEGVDMDFMSSLAKLMSKTK